MRRLVIILISPICRLGEWLIDRYEDRLNGDEDDD